MSDCVVHATGAEAIVAACRAFIDQQPVYFRYLLLRWSFQQARAVITIVVRQRDAGIDPLVAFFFGAKRRWPGSRATRT
ncbi:MAG: hypothetical protein AAGK78_14470, partial [Planctomycetota bacterium]